VTRYSCEISTNLGKSDHWNVPAWKGPPELKNNIALNLLQLIFANRGTFEQYINIVVLMKEVLDWWYVWTTAEMVEWLTAVYAYISIQRARKQPILSLDDLGHPSCMCHSAAIHLPIVSPVNPDLRTRISKAYSQAAKTLNVKRGNCHDWSNYTQVYFFEANSIAEVPYLNISLVS